MVFGFLLFVINLLCAIFNFSGMGGDLDFKFYLGCSNLSFAFWTLGVWMGRGEF